MEIYFSRAVVSNWRGCNTLAECIVGVLAALCSMLKGDIEKPSYYHLQGDVQASRCVYYVPYMQLLSVDFSFKAVWLLTVHQVLISGARDEPSSNHIRHGEAITARPFLVMVYSPNDKPTGCVGSGRVCLPFLHRGTSPRYTDRDGWRQRGESDTSGSFICNGNHAVYHRSPAALSACAMLRDIPEDCHIVCKAARHRDPQMAHSEQTRAGLSLSCHRDVLQ